MRYTITIIVLTLLLSGCGGYSGSAVKIGVGRKVGETVRGTEYKVEYDCRFGR